MVPRSIIQWTAPQPVGGAWHNMGCHLFQAKTLSTLCPQGMNLMRWEGIL